MVRHAQRTPEAGQARGWRREGRAGWRARALAGHLDQNPGYERQYGQRGVKKGAGFWI